MTTQDKRALTGIHHVTALATDPDRLEQFYSGVLGLRRVKTTVNYDDPGTYHLYYGNETGEPGTILTFFPWPGARRGTEGVGQASAVALSVPQGSLGFWFDRLRSEILAVESPSERFDEGYLRFLDPDGMRVELVAHAEAEDRTPWLSAGVPERHAVRGIHGVTLSERALDPTSSFLSDVMGMEPIASEGQRHRFSSGTGPFGSVDVRINPKTPYGRIAARRNT